MPDSKRVLLVGWDAADWKIIDPLMAAGRMPTTRRLVETGVRGNLATLFPVLSPMLWTSIATGKRAFKHGIYGFSEPAPDGKSVRPMTNTARKCKAVWNILNQNDMQSIIVGWWPSHPAEPINGCMVSDLYHKSPRRPGQSWKLMPNSIHPERCVEEVGELRLHPSELEPEHLLPFVPDAAEVDQESDGRLSQCMRVICECTTIHAATTHLMETEPWDFAAIYYDAIDHFCHGYMRYHPPKQDYVSDHDFKVYQHVVTSGYLYHDMMLARLLELAGDDATVILISDHGFHPDHLRPKLLPAEPAGPASEHRDQGIFVISGPGIRQGGVVEGVNLLDIAPTVLSVYGLPVGEDMDGRSLVEVFQEEPKIATIPSWDDVPGDDGGHPEGYAMDPVESQEALEQLIALGYIERPDPDASKAIADCQRELDYNLARAYMDAGMHGNAVPLLAALYNDAPLEFRFGVQLANCLNAMQMVDDLGRVIDDMNGRWRIARRAAAERLRAAGEIRKERRAQWEVFREIDEKNKDNPSAAKLARTNPLGEPVLFSDREMADIRKLRAVRRGNPQTLDFLEATVALSRGDDERALELLLQSEQKQSLDPVFHFHLGNVYLNLGRPEDAMRAYGKALEIDEFHPNGMLGLCRTCLEMDRIDDALDYGSRAIGLKYHLPAAHYFLARAQERSGDVERAIASYETALAQNPNFPEAHDGLAGLYSRFSDDFDEEAARKHKEAAKELRSDIAAVKENHTTIDFAPVDFEAIRAELPEIRREEDTELFHRCLAQAPREDPQESSKTAAVTIVSGLPRSGTSMMMQMLAAGGLEPYTDGCREADESNPEGYYELEQVTNLAQENSWMVDCDGRVIKVIVQLIPYLPQNIDYRVIFMEREMAEVLGSQDKMLARLNRKGARLEREQLAEVFVKQSQFAVSVMALNKVPVLGVPYAEVIADPAAKAKAIAEFLGKDLDTEAMAAAVNPSLYRERGAPSQ